MAPDGHRLDGAGTGSARISSSAVKPGSAVLPLGANWENDWAIASSDAGLA